MAINAKETGGLSRQRTNWEEKYGISLAEAKKLSRKIYGHLPHSGCMAMVKQRRVTVTVSHFPVKHWIANENIYLVNTRGKYTIYSTKSLEKELIGE